MEGGKTRAWVRFQDEDGKGRTEEIVVGDDFWDIDEDVDGGRKWYKKKIKYGKGGGVVVDDGSLRRLRWRI